MFDHYPDTLVTATLSKTMQISYVFEQKINCLQSPFARFILEGIVSKTRALFSILFVFDGKISWRSNSIPCFLIIPFKAKFHKEPSWEGGTKLHINGPGHMTKMAATPI